MLVPNSEIWQRIGKELPGAKRVVPYCGSLNREGAEFVQPRAAPDRDEGKVRSSPRQDLVAGDLDVLSQDLQLLVAAQCLLDQANQGRIIEELFDPDLC